MSTMFLLMGVVDESMMDGTEGWGICCMRIFYTFFQPSAREIPVKTNKGREKTKRWSKMDSEGWNEKITRDDRVFVYHIWKFPHLEVEQMGGDAHLCTTFAHRLCLGTHLLLPCNRPSTTTRPFSTYNYDAPGSCRVSQSGPSSNSHGAIHAGRVGQNAPALPVHNCYDADGAPLFSDSSVALNLAVYISV